MKIGVSSAQVLGFLVGAVSAGCVSSSEVVSPPDQWVLTMSDEFDGDEGTSPDSSMWTYAIGGDGWGNQQLEFNTDRVENVSLDGQGHLQIIALEESYEGNDYTSARIKTQGLFEQKYGRFEARIKLPLGAGLWPAFWLLGANVDEVPWPGCGEMDVMEFRGQNPGVAFGSLHGPGYSAGDSISAELSLPGGETFPDDFYVFAMDWDPGRITFSVDDEVYQIVRTSDIPPGGTWVFDHEFFIILNLAVGGTLGGPVGRDTEFPATMLVDYVRIYERAR